MMRPNRLRARAVVVGFLVVGFLAACSQFSLYDQFAPLTTSKDFTGPTLALSIGPGKTGTLVGGTLYFTASGGVTPYTFSVLSGGAGGTINSSGTYTAPNSSGTDTVQVKDSSGQIANASVTVVAAPPLRIVPANLQVNVGDNYPFSATGGVPPYSYSLIGTGGGVTSSGMLTATGNGSVTVTATDSIGETSTASVTIGATSLTLSPVNVEIAETKTLFVIASGGSGSYSLSLNPGSKGNVTQIDPTTHAGTYSGSGFPGSNTLTLSDGVTQVNATVTVDPAAPSNLAATLAGSTEVDLSWSNNTTSNNGGINIYRAIGNGSFSPIASALANNTTSYADTGLTTGNVYVYKVVSVKTGGGSSYYGTSNYAIAVTK